MERFLKRVLIVGMLMFGFMKLGGFRLVAESLGDQLLWCALLAAFFATSFAVVRWLLVVFSACIITMVITIPGIIVLPWIVFSLMQNNLFPGQFFITTSGFLQIIVGFILIIVWKTTE